MIKHIGVMVANLVILAPPHGNLEYFKNIFLYIIVFSPLLYNVKYNLGDVSCISAFC